MSLTTIRDFIINNQRKTLLLAALLLVLIVAATIYSWNLNRTNIAFGQIPKPKFPSLLTSTPTWDNSQTILPDVSKGTVFKVESRSFSSSEAKVIASRLGFSSQAKEIKSKAVTSLVFSTSQKELDVVLNTGEAKYTDNNKIKDIFDKPVNTKIDPIKIVQTARDYLKTIGVSVEDKVITLEVADITYFNPAKGSLDISHFPSGVDQASVALIKLRKKISTTAVYTSSGEDTVDVTVTKRGDVAGFYLRNLRVADVGAKYPLADAKTVRDQIKAGKGVLVNYDSQIQSEGGYIETKPQIVYVQTSKVVYYNDLATDYLQPVFMFACQSAKDNKFYSGSVYLPAIEPKYLK